jgi:hypothetical protein
MKTKTLLLLCLFIGIGLTKLTAQNDLNKKGTGSISFNYVYDNFPLPAFCDGIQVDMLTGTVTVHDVLFFRNWVFSKANQHFFSGELYSSVSDEVFKLIEKDHCMEIVMEGDIVTGLDIYHYNLKGNHGTHYVGTATYDLKTGEFTSVRSVCTGNDK